MFCWLLHTLERNMNMEVSIIGKDEHKNSKGKNTYPQVPKSQLTHSGDVEFAPELSQQNNGEARARSEKKAYQVERE